MKYQGSKTTPVEATPISETQQVVKQTVKQTVRQSPPCYSRLSFKVGLIVTFLLGGVGLPATSAIAQATAPNVIAQTPATATILYVNPAQGNDAPNAGSETAPFRTITYALQRAQANTVVQLAPGSYTADTGERFPLVIPSNVRLRGNASNRGQTVTIIGSGTYASPTFATQNVTIRPLSNSSVIGVTVTNPSSRGTAVWVESTNPTIRDNTFSNSARDGVFVTGTGAPIIENNTFTGNSANGVAIARTAQGEVRNNVFQNTGFGIAVGGSATTVIRGNQIVQNTDGIVISDSATPVLRGNVVQNNTRDGIVAITNARPNLGTAEEPGENLISNNGRYDLYNATRNITLLAVGNQIEDISGSVDFVAREVAGPSTFPDVQGHWAQAYIEALAARNVIGGFPDGTYRPNEPVTRAQFAAIVNNAFTVQPQRAAINFVDVRPNFWATQAIQSAYRTGFLSGYPGQIFRPEQQIPRVQALVSLASGLNLSTQDAAVLSRFQDAAQIPDWGRSAIAAATQRNIVVNYPSVGQLNPNQTATRADIAAFVYQALVSAGQAEPIPSPYVVNATQAAQ